MKDQLHRLRQPSIIDWDEMKLKLKEKCLPVDFEKAIFEELLLHRQVSSTIDDYTSKFPELTIQSQFTETETVARYKAGLRAEIRKELLSTCLVSVDEAYQLALKVKNQLKWLSVRRTNYQVGNNSGRVTRNGAIRVKKFNSPN